MSEFYYIVRIKIGRHNKNDNTLDFSVFDEKFENTNPIIAREAAFNFYHKILVSLLKAKGEEYISDSIAKTTLSNLFDIEKEYSIKYNEKMISSSKVFSSSLGVFLVGNIEDSNYDEKFNYQSLKNFHNQVLLHSVGNGIFNYRYFDKIFINLLIEKDLYSLNNFDTNNSLKSVSFCFQDKHMFFDQDSFTYKDFKASTNKILKTPFDWSGFDKPYWWETYKNNYEITDDSLKSIYYEIINSANNNQVQFCSSIIKKAYNENYEVLRESIKPLILSFFNSNGGLLFIGMNEKNNIKGLSKDFSFSRENNEIDYFLSHIDQLKTNFYPFIIYNYSGWFLKIEEKYVFVLCIFPKEKINLQK